MQKFDPKTDGTTLDIVADNIDKLRSIFPDAFTEGSDEKGPRWKVDFDALREILGDYVEDQQERYSFTWNGKSRARRIAQTPSTGTLRPCPEESVNWETTKNLFIEGDNLEVLKLLQKSYHKKVKMIYIDPPYNTGKEFIYPDKFQDNLETYLRYTGQVDANGLRITPNTETSGRYHTNWLNMMLPRLKLARNVLSEDGYIVASIDDAELANLEYLLNEVFGEENRIAVLVFDKNRKNDAKFFSVGHEYMVVYARNKSLLKELDVRLRAPKEGIDEVRSEFAKLRAAHGDDWTAIRQGLLDHYATYAADDPRQPLSRFNKVDERGPYRTDGNPSWPGGGGPRYSVPHPSTGKPCKVPSRGWVWPTYERMLEEINKGNIAFGPDESTIPSVRMNLFEKSDQVMRSVTFSYAQKSAQDFAALFDGKKVFDNPKNPHDIQRLVEYLTGGDDIVLDFFAGSCTTAHSVMLANKSDGGNRRYICVQLPEWLDDQVVEQKAGHAFCISQNLSPTIAEIGKERIRRSSRFLAGKPESSPTPGEQVSGSQSFDYGFKVLKLESSNIKTWDADFDNLENSLFNAAQNIKLDRTEADVLHELLLKFGLDLAIPIEERDISGKTVYVIGNGALIASLADDITLDVVEGIAELRNELTPKVMRVVLKDTGFKDDVVKTNAVQILRQAGIDDVKSL